MGAPSTFNQGVGGSIPPRLTIKSRIYNDQPVVEKTCSNQLVTTHAAGSGTRAGVVHDDGQRDRRRGVRGRCVRVAQASMTVHVKMSGRISRRNAPIGPHSTPA